MIFYIPKFRQGGLEKVFSKYLTSLCNFKKITLLCDKGSKEYLPLEMLEQKNLNIIYLPNPRTFRILGLCWYIFHHRVEVVNAVQIDALKPVLFLSLLIKLSVIYHERTFVSPKDAKFISKLLKFKNVKIKKVLVNSDDQKKLFAEYFPDLSVERLYNPIINAELKKLKRVRRDYKSVKDNMTLLCSGRIDEQKNLNFILENSKAICSQANFKKIIIYVGSLDYDETLNSEYVEIRVFTSNFLEQAILADAAIITTNYEGFSSLIFELNYLNIPVFCSYHIHGFDELNKIFHMTIFKRNDVMNLIECLKQLKAVDNVLPDKYEKLFSEKNSLYDFKNKVCGG